MAAGHGSMTKRKLRNKVTPKKILQPPEAGKAIVMKENSYPIDFSDDVFAETHNTQILTWHYDKKYLTYHIIAGCGHNPINNLYQDISIIHLPFTVVRKLHKHIQPFLENFPDTHYDWYDIIDTQKKNLFTQFAGLSSSYKTYSINHIEMSILLDLGAEISCYYISLNHLYQKVRRKEKVRGKPIVKFTLGHEHFYYFIQELKKTPIPTDKTDIERSRMKYIEGRLTGSK